MRPKLKLLLLGATGSIGGSTVEVLRLHREHVELVGIAGHSNWEGLASIAREFSVRHVGIFDEKAAAGCDRSCFPEGTQIYAGMHGLMDLAVLPEAETVLSAIVGTTALHPTLAALESGKRIALANKEILVLAGRFVMDAVRRHGRPILPVDSEHNAIFQCLDGQKHSHLSRLILTASGGAFRDRPLSELESVTPDEALAHPNWDMGPKVTVDSATMANKGLELIEARWLFNTPPERLAVVLHPQSIIHSMVEFIDGTILAQLSPPSMTFAIQHALLYPERMAPVHETLDFTKAIQLDFRPLEPGRYRCLDLARSALESGGSSPAVFNAANEIAVDSFLKRKIAFLEIPSLIGFVLDKMPSREPSSLDEVLEIDREARSIARTFSPPHAI